MVDIENSEIKRQLKILIIDDNPGDRLLYKRLLQASPSKGQDWIILEADNGEAARELWQVQQPDCVLLDYSLPDMTGLELLSTFGKNHKETSLPVVMLTGAGDENVAVAAMKLGAQDYLRKGNLSSESLCLAINNTIQRIASIHKAKELESMKSEFLSTASHELRTPLTIIKEFVSLVRDEVTGTINREQNECLTSALKNCERLSNLINDILDLQKMECGNLNLSRRKVVLASLIESCQSDFQALCLEKKQQLNVMLTADLPAALCDPNKITQVLVNLISNAHKFTPEGGRITITASRSQDDENFILVEVSDTGKGIGKEDQNRVWGKFTQVGRTDGPGARGTGLGLAIVRNLVELHGGIVGLASEEGQGATFSFTIPVYDELKEMTSFIADRLTATLSEGKQLSVTLVKCDSASQLSEIDQCLRNALRRKDDKIMIVESENTIVVTAAVKKDDVSVVWRRIEQAINVQFGVLIANCLVGLDKPVNTQLIFMKEHLHSISPSPLAKRVLIIDDEEEILELASTAFESSPLNLHVTVESNGYNACLHLLETTPDLVVLDAAMPGFDGIQVIERLRNSSIWRGLKVLVISGDKNAGAQMVELGADDFLAKPFNPQDLIVKSAKLLGIENEEACDTLQSVVF